MLIYIGIIIMDQFQSEWFSYKYDDHIIEHMNIGVVHSNLITERHNHTRYSIALRCYTWWMHLWFCTDPTNWNDNRTVRWSALIISRDDRKCNEHWQWIKLPLHHFCALASRLLSVDRAESNNQNETGVQMNECDRQSPVVRGVLSLPHASDDKPALQYPYNVSSEITFKLIRWKSIKNFQFPTVTLKSTLFRAHWEF